MLGPYLKKNYCRYLTICDHSQMKTYWKSSCTCGDYYILYWWILPSLLCSFVKISRYSACTASLILFSCWNNLTYRGSALSCIPFASDLTFCVITLAWSLSVKVNFRWLPSAVKVRVFVTRLTHLNDYKWFHTTLFYLNSVAFDLWVVVFNTWVFFCEKVSSRNPFAVCVVHCCDLCN